MEHTPTHPLSPEEAKERLRVAASLTSPGALLLSEVTRRPKWSLAVAFLAGFAAGSLNRQQWAALTSAVENALPYLVRYRH